MKEKRSQDIYYLRTALYVAASLIAAFMFSKVDIPTLVSFWGESSRELALFVGGLGFVSLFTVAPASVALGQLSLSSPLWEVVFFGSLGATCVDTIIFIFFRDTVAREIPQKKLFAFYHGSKFRRTFFTRLIGLLIIATPLPDEIGLAFLGISHMKLRHFLPLVFLVNCIGILAISAVANSIT